MKFINEMYTKDRNGGENMAKAGNYYYEQLNKEQQRAYYAIKEGLLKLQDSFTVPILSGEGIVRSLFSDSYGLSGDFLFGNFFL